MSSSSSPRGNSLGIVPVLFLIAMDEQTFSLILPYQPAKWLPKNSPERRPPAARVGLVSGTYWSRKDLFPRDGRMFGGEERSAASGIPG